MTLDLQPEPAFVPGFHLESKLSPRIMRRIEEQGALNDRYRAIFASEPIDQQKARELAADYDARGIHDRAREVLDRAGIKRIALAPKIAAEKRIKNPWFNDCVEAEVKPIRQARAVTDFLTYKFIHAYGPVRLKEIICKLKFTPSVVEKSTKRLVDSGEITYLPKAGWVVVVEVR